MDVYFKYMNVISFHSNGEDGDKLFTTSLTNDTIYYPEKGANAITMGTLLFQNALQLQEMFEYGAILRINFVYNCELRFNECEPEITFDELNSDNDG